MSIYTQLESNNFSRKLIGEILKEAGLISSPQLEIALDAQSQGKHFRLGEILVSKGWLSQKTIDFLVDVFSLSNLNKYLHKQPIGYYLQEAGLLTSEQINSIVNDQKKIGIKFCYLAVIKGFLQPKTADFFLHHVAKKFSVASTISDLGNNCTDKAQTVIIEDNHEQNVIQNENAQIIEYDRAAAGEPDRDLTTVNDLGIQSSSIWIDFTVSS